MPVTSASDAPATETSRHGRSSSCLSPLLRRSLAQPRERLLRSDSPHEANGLLDILIVDSDDEREGLPTRRQYYVVLIHEVLERSWTIAQFPCGHVFQAEGLTEKPHPRWQLHPSGAHPTRSNVRRQSSLCLRISDSRRSTISWSMPSSQTATLARSTARGTAATSSMTRPTNRSGSSSHRTASPSQCRRRICQT